MLIYKKFCACALILGAGILILTGCGQTGALYLPSVEEAIQPKEPAETAPANRAKK